MANGWVKNSLARCPVRARPHCRSAFHAVKELLRVTRPLDVIYYYLPGGGVMKADRPRGRIWSAGGGPPDTLFLCASAMLWVDPIDRPPLIKQLHHNNCGHGPPPAIKGWGLCIYRT